jgi:hypothetical protein
MARATPRDRSDRIELNTQYVPAARSTRPEPTRTVPNEGVCDAFYPYGNQPHGHHLQDAQDDIDMAVWSWGEQGRQLQQEDKNHDETIKSSSKR